MNCSNVGELAFFYVALKSASPELLLPVGSNPLILNPPQEKRRNREERERKDSN